MGRKGGGKRGGSKSKSKGGKVRSQSPTRRTRGIRSRSTTPADCSCCCTSGSADSPGYETRAPAHLEQGAAQTEVELPNNNQQVQNHNNEVQSAYTCVYVSPLEKGKEQTDADDTEEANQEDNENTGTAKVDAEQQEEKHEHEDHETDTNFYEEPESNWKRRLALLTNPYYNSIKGNHTKAKMQVMLRSAFVIMSIVGAILQTSGTLNGECFVESRLGGFETFPNNFNMDLFFSNMFTPRTVICSPNFDQALERAQEDDSCGFTGYNATSYFTSSLEVNVSYINLRRSGRTPFDIPFEDEVSIDSCLNDSHVDRTSNGIGLTGKDECGLLPWVSGTATLGPGNALYVTIVMCLMAGIVTLVLEMALLRKIEFNDLQGEGLLRTWLRRWKSTNVAAVPTSINLFRLFSSNIWYVPFVTLEGVPGCSKLSFFQTSLPLTILIGVVSLVFVFIFFRITHHMCRASKSNNASDHKGSRRMVKIVIIGGSIGGFLITLQYAVYLIDNWRLITSLISNSSVDQLTSGSGGLEGIQALGKVLLQLGGWGSGIWDIKELLESSMKVHVRETKNSTQG